VREQGAGALGPAAFTFDAAIVLQKIGPALGATAAEPLFFGASRIGDIGKGLGRGIREFRHELHEAKEEEPAKPSDAVATGTTAMTVTTSEPKRPQTTLTALDYTPGVRSSSALFVVYSASR
jgi:Sec-independent protein translocase protein TatA